MVENNLELTQIAIKRRVAKLKRIVSAVDDEQADVLRRCVIDSTFQLLTL